MTQIRPLALMMALTGCASTQDSMVDATLVDAAVVDGAGIDAPVDAPAATCAPECGAHATCDGALCVCDEGFQGDGFSCHRYWELIASYPFDISPLPFWEFSYGQWPHVVGHRRSIFIGVQSHMTLTYPGWRSLDLAAVPPTLSGPLTLPPEGGGGNELCTCGNDARLSSDGVRYVYMFGTNAQRYDVTTNQWFSNAPTYRSSFNRSQSPEVFVPADGTILFFGGHGFPVPLDTVLRYTVANDSFAIDPTPMPAPLTNAVAWLPTGGSTIYLGGGKHDWPGNAMFPHNRIISRPTSSNVWTTHPDAPGDLRYPVGMGDYQGRIWVAARELIFMNGTVESRHARAHFFNPATDTWDRTIFLPTGTLAAVTADGATWALARTEAGGVAGFDLYKLVAIDETPEP